MYRRLIILSFIIAAAMTAMVWLGYRSIKMWEKGLQGQRLGEFAQAAEQIRRDVSRKLTEFMNQERNRPYTDYQYYYVPANAAPNQQLPILTSPLRFSMSNGLAYGYFQIDGSGHISTPYFNDGEGNYREIDERAPTIQEVEEYRDVLRKKVVPLVRTSSKRLAVPAGTAIQTPTALSVSVPQKLIEPPAVISYDQTKTVTTDRDFVNANELKVESLLPKESGKTQVFYQQRQYVEINVISNAPAAIVQEKQAAVQADTAMKSHTAAAEAQEAPHTQSEANQASQNAEELVNITVESFVPVVVEDKDSGPIFSGHVYLLRHVKIEDRDIIQGFRFDEKKLLEEVYDSAHLIPGDMSFLMQPGPDSGAAYTAVLSFGRGELVIGFKDKDPARLINQITSLRNWYFGTVGVVVAAAGLGLASLWRNVRAQAVLAAKKDDFISAVSHELRTPLTSIRMHSEMLERNWVKSQDKLAEYYRSMRQESERLSRLIENVLDFSRIQRGRKKYNFAAGDLNKCISDVVEMMKPYAAQTGFEIKTDLGQIPEVVFDRDSLTQIVVNLIDNAIKYSRAAEEKIVLLRTRAEGHKVMIEVEDRGPGIPHSERKKIFNQFYRIAAESTREVPGTGLGLALVKRFVEAHKGFIEVLSAEPTGAIFRVVFPAG